MDEEHKPSLEDTMRAGTIDARSKGHDIIAGEDDERLAHWRIEGGSVWVTHCRKCGVELVVERGGGAWVYAGIAVVQNCRA
jgi:hypothetical protein